MQIMVIYDSMYGNTQKVAEEMAHSLASGGAHTAILKRAAEASAADLGKVDLLLIGSPVQAGRPLKTTQAWLDHLPREAVKGLKFAAFDTRMTGNFPRLFGWAAKRISAALQKKGAVMVVEPEGFFVAGKEGPMLEGEIARAGQWAQQVAAATARS